MLEGLDKGLIFEFLDKYPKLSKDLKSSQRKW